MQKIQGLVTVFGHIFSGEGEKLASTKVYALLKRLDPPKRPAEVRSLLGMAQYSAQFVPNFSEITAPLTSVNSQECELEKDHQRAEVIRKPQRSIVV